MTKEWGPGNPLWEWKRKHGKLKSDIRKAHTRKRRGGDSMRGRRHRSRGRGFNVMRIVKRGAFPLMGGVLGSLLTGAAIGYAQKNGYIPKFTTSKYEEPGVALLAGGVPGVLGSLIVKGGVNGGSSAANVKFYG